MAITKGCNGQVLSGANAVAELRTWELNEEMERVDTSVMGSCVRRYDVGPTTASGTFTCYMDDSDTDGQGTLPVAGAVTLALYPGGTGSGLPARTFPALIEQVAERAQFEGYVERDYTYVATGAVDRTPQT